MSNRKGDPRARSFSADAVQRIQAGYEARLARQKKTIDSLLAEREEQNAAMFGMRCALAAIVKREGGELSVSNADIDEIDFRGLEMKMDDTTHQLHMRINKGPRRIKEENA